MFLTTNKMASVFSETAKKKAYYGILYGFEVCAAPIIKIIFKMYARVHIINRDVLHNIAVPYIVVANHASYADPFLLGAVPTFMQSLRFAPYCFMTHPKYLRLPVFGNIIRLIGAFPVFPKAEGGLEDALAVAKTILEEKKSSMVVFPEGKRSDKHYHHAARPGIAYLVKKFPDRVIVPMYIHNSRSLRPWRLFFLRPRVTVIIGKPFTCRDIDGEQKDNIALAQEIMKRVTNLEKKEKVV